MLFRTDEEREINHHGRPVEVGETKKTKKYNNKKKTKKIQNTKKTKKTKNGRPVKVGDGEAGTGPGSSSDKVGSPSPSYLVMFYFDAKKRQKRQKKTKRTKNRKDKKTNKATPQTNGEENLTSLCFILMFDFYRKWSSLLNNNRWFLFLRRTWLQ